MRKLDLPMHIVYEDGRIYSKFFKRTLNPHITKAGYYRVKMGTRNVLLHRLLAIHFIPNPQNKTEVNHKDGNKLNYSLSNLEWNTPSENSQHAYDTGLQSKVGSKNTKAILDEGKVIKIRGSEHPRRLLASKFGVSLNTIHDILARRTWNHV